MRQANKPKFRKYIFAESAKATNIENVPDTQSAEQERQGYIGYQHGYTEYNMKPLTEGGKPPRGQQLNQVLKDITSVTQYATVGGTYGIDNDVVKSTGYPKNAIICVDDVGLFRSLRDDNKEFNYKDTDSWKKVVDFNPKFYQQRILGEVFFANRLDNPDGCLKCDGREYDIKNYPRLQKYMENGKVKYTSYSDYKSMVDSTGSCILFAWDKEDKFRAPTLKCGTMLSNVYGTIELFRNTEKFSPEFGSSYLDQIYDFVKRINGVVIRDDAYYQGELEVLKHGLSGDSVNKKGLLLDSVIKLNENIKGSQTIPRTAYLYAFVVVNDYFTTTLDFKRDDSNDSITPGDGVWEVVEQYDFTDKNELEFTYSNNERYKLFLSNLTVNTESPSYLRAKISPNGDSYIEGNFYFNKINRIGSDNYDYTGPFQNERASFMCMDIYKDDNDKLSKGDLTNIEIDIPKGFNNNKKQFILHSTRTKHNGNKIIYFNGITSIISESFGNIGKIKIKIDDNINRLSGNASLYKIN